MHTSGSWQASRSGLQITRTPDPLFPPHMAQISTTVPPQATGSAQPGPRPPPVPRPPPTRHPGVHAQVLPATEPQRQDLVHPRALAQVLGAVLDQLRKLGKHLRSTGRGRKQGLCAERYSLRCCGSTSTRKAL